MRWRSRVAIASATGAIALALLLLERRGAAGALAIFASSLLTILAVPDSAAASARSVIVGHGAAFLVSVCLVHVFGSSPPVIAAALAISVFVMLSLGRAHPPAAGTPLVVAASHESVQVLAAIVVAGCALLSAISVVRVHMRRRSAEFGDQSLTLERCALPLGDGALVEARHEQGDHEG